mmetsp:Transcript_43785/g.68458  ORF Transcript_43785/g.68458 Transcript_43785/m.68458 type:complete len:84 (-) Transcript_43785:2-253(-)
MRPIRVCMQLKYVQSMASVFLSLVIAHHETVIICFEEEKKVSNGGKEAVVLNKVPHCFKWRRKEKKREKGKLEDKERFLQSKD